MFAARTGWNLTPNRLAAALGKRRAAGKELLDLTLSNPTLCGFRYDRKDILRSLANAAALKYQPEPTGLASARQAVADYYQQRSSGVHSTLDREHVVLTSSTSEAYSFIFRLLCDPGDEVLAPVPSYPLFEFLAAIQDVRLLPYALFYDHGWAIDFASLETAATARTRAVVVVHPNNPTGSFLKSAEAARLDDFAAARQIAIVADEVFLDYPHDGVTRPSFSGQNHALTFTLSGLSKVAALPQMKLAWMVVSGPRSLTVPALARLEFIADTYLSPGTPVQQALPFLLEQRHKIQAQMRARIRQNCAELDRQLASLPGCSRIQSEGGWYAVVRVPVTSSDEELAIGLLEQAAVLVHPGHFYDFATEGHLVLSLIPKRSDLREGVARLLAFLRPRAG